MSSLDIFTRIKAALKGDGKIEILQDLVYELGNEIKQIQLDIEGRRVELVCGSSVLDICWCILEEFQASQGKKEFELTLRLCRGTVIYLRNLSTVIGIDCGRVIKSVITFWEKISVESMCDLDEWPHKTLVSYFELLSNSSRQISVTPQDEDLIKSFLLLCAKSHICEATLLRERFFIILRRWTENNEIAELISSSSQLRSLIQQMAVSIIDLPSKDQISLSDECLIHAFGNICFTDGFADITRRPCSIWSPENTSQILRACQLVMTSDVGDLSLHKLLKWLHQMVCLLEDRTMEAFSHPRDLENIKWCNLQTVSILDILSHVVQQKTVIFQMGLKADLVLQLGKLLEIVHNNAAVVTLKSENNEALIEYPWVKSMIIEVLGYLCCGDYEVQNSLRTNHILELILSNCVIDDSNPYIKERSILCIKHALENNPSNQSLVAELEAKQVVNESALKNTGYETKIEEGKVKIKKVS